MPFNSALVESITAAIPPWLAVIVLVFSYLGSVYIIGPSAVAAYLWGDRERTATWLGTILAAYALFVFLKPVFDIPRPDTAPPIGRDAVPLLLAPLYDLAVGFETGSFPSGHALVATVFWGLVVLDLRVSTLRRRLLTAIVVISIVGFARVGLGVHFVEDVIAGILLGLGVLAVAITVRERVDNPAKVLLGMVTIPVAGSFLVGATTNASILLTAVVLCYVVDTRVDSSWQPPIPMIVDSDRESLSE